MRPDMKVLVITAVAFLGKARCDVTGETLCRLQPASRATMPCGVVSLLGRVIMNLQYLACTVFSRRKPKIQLPY